MSRIIENEFPNGACFSLCSPAFEAGEHQSHSISQKGSMMTGKTFEELRKDFLASFNRLALYKHRYDVFRDFVTMSAISLRNAIVMNDELEAEYLKIVGSYEKEDQYKFPQLLAILVELLEFGPRDVLGNLFETLELTSKNMGQFFTPHTVSELMADLLGGGEIEFGDKPFITLSEPACGAGGMILAFVKKMLKSGHSPSDWLWVQAIDVDRMAALMCYVQLTLWHVPAEVIVGNSLSMEVRETWFTPAHILGNWSYKLRHQAQANAMKRESEPEVTSNEKASEINHIDIQKAGITKPIQFDFGF